MNAFFIFRLARVFKYEVLLIGSVLILLTGLPIAIVIAMADGMSFSASSTGLYTGPGDPSDIYAYGNCTWWAYYLRKQNNDPIPTTWGNANTWAIRAKADGYLVDNTPSVGAVMQTSLGPLGHVAYVSSVDLLNGTWTISEMNAIGFDVVDSKTLTISQSLAYNFIHDKVVKTQ